MQNQKRKCKEASHLSLIIARSTAKAEEAVGERAEKPDHLKKENPTNSAQKRNPTKSTKPHQIYWRLNHPHLFHQVPPLESAQGGVAQWVFLSLLVFAGIQSQPHKISIYFRNMTKSNNPFDHKILQDCLVKTEMNSEILPDGYANKNLRLCFFCVLFQWHPWVSLLRWCCRRRAREVEDEDGDVYSVYSKRGCGRLGTLLPLKMTSDEILERPAGFGPVS